MPNQNQTETGARKVLPIIFVLDTSGSMAGAKITAVNEAMVEVMPVLQEISDENADAEIRVGIVSFSSGARWETDGLKFMDDIILNDLVAAGVTDLGDALKALHNKLSRSEYLESEAGFNLPVIIFMSDGQPTDDYESALTYVTQNNKWFAHSTKIGIAVGEDADYDVLTKITGNSEAVTRVHDTETLKRLIKVVAATASKIGSKSRSSLDKDLATEIMETSRAEIGEDVQPDSYDEPAVDPSATQTPSPDVSTDSNDDWDDNATW